MLDVILKFIVGTTLGIAAALLITFNALLLWVATGPRSLDQLSPFIAASFKTPHQEFSVKIGHTILIWDGWKHPIDIRLKDVTVLDNKGQAFSTFPQISVGIDIVSLLGARILPTSLTITHPGISLFQNEDHSISFGFNKAEPAAAPASGDVPFAAMLAPLVTPDETGSLRKLSSVTILDADVSIANRKKGVFFTASDAIIDFRRNRHGISEASIGATIRYGSSQSLIDARFTVAKGQSTIEGVVSFSRLMPGTLAALFSGNKAFLAANFPLSGRSSLSLDMNGTVQRLNFAIEGGVGMIQSDKLEKPLPIDALHVEGQLSNNFNDIQIDRLTAQINGSALSASGVISLSGSDMSVRGNGSLGNVKADDVRLLWPPSLSPNSRDWIVTNVTDGDIISAGVQLNIPFGDLSKPQLPKDDIHATVSLDGAKIRYLPEHPEVSHIKGIVHIDAMSLETDIQSADYMKDTKLSNGKLWIADLNADNPYIKLSFDAESSAKDIVRLLGLPRLKHATRLNLHEETVMGSVQGHADLGFYFFAPKDKDEADFDYAISGEAKNISIPAFMKKFDIVNGNGKLSVNNKGLEFNGKGDINGAGATSADVKYLFAPENGLDTFIDVTAAAPVESLPRFGYPQFPFLKGTLGIKASLKEGDAAEQSKANIDLTNAAVTLPDFGWIKPEKIPAALDITVDKKNGAVSLPSFHLTGKDMDVRGSAALNADLSDFKRVQLDKVLYGKNDLDSVLYEPFQNGWHIELHGDSADLSGWLGDGNGDHSFSFEHFPVLALKADVAHVILGKGRELSAVTGTVNCDRLLCNSANIKGKTADGKPFAFLILRNPKHVRQLSLHAQGAGEFLKAAGIFDGMQGGDLSITGNYDDSGPSSALKGKADITEYTVHNAPILGRILSLMSLTGFFDTLQGRGIHFDRLVAPFTLSKDVITLDGAKTHGDAIGMTVDGTITFPRRELNLKGTIVPSYTLNHVLGNVPLVGKLLTGGEGQGVFAARYSVNGSVKNPDVSVNPLSMLTPGFLRGVFDILDTGPSKKKGDESQ